MSVILFLLCFYSLDIGHAGSTTFDQRQNGELNVQVDLKDLRILAVLKGGKEEYVDYDYAYDYSEMTIKPQNRTTPKPLNVGSTSATLTTQGDITKDNATVATTVLLENTISPVYNKTELTLDSVTATSKATVNDYTSTVKNHAESVTEPTPSPEKNVTVVSTPSNSTNCRKGFVLNLKGDCELKLPNTGNALLKLVKLSQKLKLRRENKSDQDNTKQ